MGNLKLAAVLSITLLLGLLCAPAMAQDEETEVKAKDTPYFSGMPNYTIFDAGDKEFAAWSFFNGKDCTTVEGRKFYSAYTLKEGAKQASDLQISATTRTRSRTWAGPSSSMARRRTTAPRTAATVWWSERW